MRFPFQNEGQPDFKGQQEQMIEKQLRPRGIADPNVLEAMRRVPRHAFVPEEHRERSYDDGPLPIGEGQTISQPYIVALMTEALGLAPEAKVLEVGTGSGYQTAVLAEAGYEVYTIEFVEFLAVKARQKLDELGYDSVHFRMGDGHAGWPDAAPFDGILVTAAPAEVPEALLEQLAPDGRLVIPVGRNEQELRVYEKDAEGNISSERLCFVRFVPLVK